MSVTCQALDQVLLLQNIYDNSTLRKGTETDDETLTQHNTARVVICADTGLCRMGETDQPSFAFLCSCSPPTALLPIQKPRARSQVSVIDTPGNATKAAVDLFSFAITTSADWALTRHLPERKGTHLALKEISLLGMAFSRQGVLLSAIAAGLMGVEFCLCYCEQFI